MGTIPTEWKMANVVPVYKKGSKTLVENYRPISLTCLIMKVFEKIIRDELMIKVKHLINEKQHGFLPEKSCTTQMVSFYDSLAVTINDSSRTDVIYFDFAKAFDSVNHDIILHKLKHQYKIDGIMLKFLVEYLINRKQSVVIRGAMSDVKDVTSGVPQGSILGPLLFVLFINDMSSHITQGTNIALYADDTKIWRRINNYSDHVVLQNDINALFKWSQDNKMNFHPKKCKVLVVTLETRQSILPFDRYPYCLNNACLDYVSSEKDLGVLIDERLNWKYHCFALSKKARCMLGLLKRTCNFVDNIAQRRILYLSLIRSNFEHCSVIWRPHNVNVINKIENVQRKGVKWILSEQYVDYSDEDYLQRLHMLDILPINEKFVFNDLNLFHRILYQNVPITLPHYLSLFSPSSNRLRSTHKDALHFVSSIRPRATFRSNKEGELECDSLKEFENSYFYRAHLEWNKLPLKLRIIDSYTNFQERLKEHLWIVLMDKPD